VAQYQRLSFLGSHRCSILLSRNLSLLNGRPPEEIVAKLRQAEVLIGQGKTVADAVRAIGVSEPTWRN